MTALLHIFLALTVWQYPCPGTQGPAEPVVQFISYPVEGRVALLHKMYGWELYECVPKDHGAGPFAACTFETDTPRAAVIEEARLRQGEGTCPCP